MSVAPEHMQPAPAAPAAPTPEQKLEKILKDFQDAHKTSTTDPGQNLRDLLDKSPDLKARILDSVAKGHLEKFDVLPAGANAGGTYNSGNKTIELPLHHLNDAKTNKAAAAELVFVMGHEIQHSFNSTVSDKALEAFRKTTGATANGPGPHDHTQAVKDFISAYRKDEAGAHIGGFNAIASQVLKEKPDATLKDFYNAAPGRMGDFIERKGTAPSFTYEMKPGLTLGADKTLATTPENVEAMGKHYFDKPGTVSRLGPNGNQSYTNYYADWAMGDIARTEAKVNAEKSKADPTHVPAKVEINLQSLGVDKTVLTNGLGYTDTTPGRRIEVAPSAPHTGGHDHGGHDHPHPHAARAEPPLYSQAVAALEKLGPAAGVQGEELRNVAAAMAVQAQKDGLTQISGAVQGKDGNVISFQGDPASDQARRSAVDVDVVKAQPADKALAGLQQAPARGEPEAPQRAQQQGM